MTRVLQVPFRISTATGDAALTTTLNTALAVLAQPPVPTCTNFEVVHAYVIDPADTKFLRLGTFHN